MPGRGKDKMVVGGVPRCGLGRRADRGVHSLCFVGPVGRGHC